MSQLLQLTPHSRWPVFRTARLLELEHQLQCLSPIHLMQRAGTAAAQLALAVAPHARHIWIAAGPGNNGGDGLETALNLHQWGKNVTVNLTCEPARLPPDAQQAWKRAKQTGVDIQYLPSSDRIPNLSCHDLCIDALLGLGASRPLSPELSAWVTALNQSPAPILALDVPTGLHPESGQLLNNTSDEQAQVVKAAHTLTFIGAKAGLFMGFGRDACGQIWLSDLNVDPQDHLPMAKSLSAPDAWLNAPMTHQEKKHASHKGTHGDVAIVGGEPLSHRGMGMTGAALLAASAALHAGAGRVILGLLDEAEISNAPADLMQRAWSRLDLENLHVVCGCGGGQAILSVMPDILRRSAQLVLDADGLNALAENEEWRQQLRQRGTHQATVITPHPLEAARLLKTSTAQIQGDRLKAAKELSDQLACTVVLKGSGTVIAAPGQTSRINTSGNGKLATGGTGDVLAGLIGAHMARGHVAFSAACRGVAQHGQLADQWPEQLALTASRLSDHLW